MNEKEIKECISKCLDEVKDMITDYITKRIMNTEEYTKRTDKIINDLNNVSADRLNYYIKQTDDLEKENIELKDKLRKIEKESKIKFD